MSRRPAYVRFVMAYVVLELLCVVFTAPLEERFPAGVQMFGHSAQIPWPQLGLYALGVFALRVPLGTLAALVHPSGSGLLGLVSVVPNALLAAWLFARLGRSAQAERSSGSKSGNSTRTG